MRDGVRLPDEVRARLTNIGAAETPSKDLVVVRGQRLEARSWRNVELREARTGDDGSVTVPLVGYSTTFSEPYEVFGGPDVGGWLETMSAGSWDKTIKESDIRLLENHEGAPLARTKSGTLRLSTDAVGVLNEADLDATSPRVQSILSAVRRGDMDQMSCAFMVTRQEWSSDYTERRVLEVVGNDSSIVTFPANTNTLVMAHTLRAASYPAAPVDSTDPTGSDDATTACPTCGKPVPADAAKCPECGADMNADRSAKRGLSVGMARALADQLRYARTG